ncbi:MAG: hypothetical protein CMJ90_04565, partial [Planctomycetes bacterium]|nr:hypothetical protein [Planctomycetota bacterium]
DKIAWYENTGGGTFGTQQVITTNADGAYSVYATDLDGDGDNDVLSASYFDNKIAWYENTGGGTFGTQQVITTNADGPYTVYATDLDGDGDADVLYDSFNDNKIAWCENLYQPVFVYQAAQASNGDATLSLSYGQASAPYYIFHSTDPLNGTSPGTGFIGLHISIADLGTQITLAAQGNPLFGGTLDGNGAFTMSLPGGAVAFLSGTTWYGMGVQVNPSPTGIYDATSIQNITFQ